MPQHGFCPGQKLIVQHSCGRHRTAGPLQCIPHLPCFVAQSVKQAQVSNYLVVAIDTALRDQLQSEGINVYYRDVKVTAIAL